MRRIFALAAAAVVCLCVTLPPASPARADPLDDKTRAAVDRGLKWLAGRWDAEAPLEVLVARQKSGSVAVSALTGLALLAADDAKPGEGPYGGAVRQCLAAVLASQNEKGVFAPAQAHGPMYGHGFATAFVAEAFARSQDARLLKPLELAVKAIVKSQNAEGGWRYQPVPHDADISVTSVQLVALRAAARAGVAVEADVINRATGYVAKCQNADGGFRYMATMPPGGGGSGLPRSAAGTTALHAWGKADDKGREQALNYLTGQLAEQVRTNWSNEGHFYYAGYYLSEALWHAGRDRRARDLPLLRDELLARQRPDGSWEGDYSADYATAMALIALQVPGERLGLAKPPDAVKPDAPRADAPRADAPRADARLNGPGAGSP